MITAIKDKDIKVITRGAYEQFYKPLGYIILEDKTKDTKAKAIDEKNNDLDEMLNKKTTIKKSSKKTGSDLSDLL